MGDNNGNPDPVVTSIGNKLRPLSTLSHDCCIFRVPKILRQLNEDAYRPTCVSIGPYYYDDPNLRPMQQEKLRYLQSFLQRNIANRDMGDYVRFIRQRQEGVRNCYVEQIGLNDDIFVEMVFIDAAFIIELFLRLDGHYPNRINVGSDHIFGKPRMIEQVLDDLILEENQLPFFILNDLYNWVFAPNFPNGSFIKLTNSLFRNMLDYLACDTLVQPPNIIEHFVDFLRMSHLPSRLRPEYPNGKTQTHSESKQYNSENQLLLSPSVTKLSEAGVRFKVSESNNLLDIRFTKGVLEIPRLTLTDRTESLFRNIIVLEQCHYHLDSYIIDYFAFLDGLINTSSDVEILVQNGIIDNWLGSYEQAANLFNNMFKHVSLNTKNFYYSGVCRALNEYSSTPWHQWRYILVHRYFNHPWAAISVIYAIFILILTLLQVITGFTNK